MINFFQKYLAINTSAPTPNYNQAIELFIRQAEEDGFSIQIVELPKNLKALIISYYGSDTTLPALLLNHHMDVVPAPDRTSWFSDPFDPLIKDGFIYARGTQDMKGVGVAHYFAMQKLKKEGFIPKRSIHLIAVPDEECGGFDGAGQLVNSLAFKNLNAGYILDEGVSSGDASLLRIKVAERKPIQVRFVSKGDMVHGSRLACKNAAHELIIFLAKLVEHQEHQKNKLDSVPAGLLLSMNITSLTAGIIINGVVALNVVGDLAEATVDIRVPPTMQLVEVYSFLDAIIPNFSGITYTVISTVEERHFNAEYKNDFYLSIAQAIEDCGYIPQPFYAEESSDLRFYFAKKIQGFGLSPFTVKDNLHGVNECISLEDLERGRDIFVRLLKIFCL